MPERSPYRIELAEPAARDFDEIIDWTLASFGEDATIRYADLIAKALEDSESDPLRVGSQSRPELPAGVLVYHLALSRDRARSGLGIVKNPRHFVVYQVRAPLVVVLRLLHDAQDLPRHIPDPD